MEAVAYVAEQDATPEFRTMLWRFMQNFGDSPMRHKEMASKLEKVGFHATENNVTHWLNGDRTPPPGLPYYATLALRLEEDEGQQLAWAYSRSYKDNRKGARRSGVNVVPDKKSVPQESALTEENREYIAEKKETYKADIERKRMERENGGASVSGDSRKSDNRRG
jgi:hypothetical protein